MTNAYAALNRFLVEAGYVIKRSLRGYAAYTLCFLLSAGRSGPICGFMTPSAGPIVRTRSSLSLTSGSMLADHADSAGAL